MKAKIIVYYCLLESNRKKNLVLRPSVSCQVSCYVCYFISFQVMIQVFGHCLPQKLLSCQNSYAYIFLQKVMKAEDIKNRSKAMSMLSIETLCSLLKFVIQRMKYPDVMFCVFCQFFPGIALKSPILVTFLIDAQVMLSMEY